MKQTTGMEMNLNSKETSYCRSFLISSLLGFFFGLIVIILTFFNGEKPYLQLFALPIFCGILSGLAGISSDFLDTQFLKWGMNSPLKRRLISFGICLVACLIISVLVFLNGNFQSIFDGKILWGVFAGSIFGIIVVLVEYNYWKIKKQMLILELENKHLEEQVAMDTILKEATKNLVLTRERNRMARELHDSVSQGIHGIIYCISSLRQQLKRIGVEEDKVIKIVNHMEKTAAGSIDELHSMIRELKPALLEKKGLTEALHSYCELFSKRQQIKVELELASVESLSPEREFAIFRITQEALTNVQKHAQASMVKVILKAEAKSAGEQSAILSIKDNGRGFHPEQIIKGNGLHNIALRSRQNGGIFHVNSAPDKGTEIKVRFI